jgi:Bacterial regulatory proteins, luxR family
MAEGHSNPAIARRLALSASAVEKHIGNIFAELGLPPRRRPAPPGPRRSRLPSGLTPAAEE